MTDKRTLQKEDLSALRFLNGGALSQDGERVVYAVNKISAEDDREYSTIYLHDIGTGETRPMTTGAAADSQPQWSPDGKSIAFVSDRGGKAQLYLLPADGGEARQLTQFKRGIGGGVAWSPDGGKIAFSAATDAEAPDLGKEAYRLDRTVYRFDGIGYLDDAVQDIYVLDLVSGEIQRLTDDRGNNSNPRWAPDGRSLLYDANMRFDNSRAMTPDLKTVDLDGVNPCCWRIGRAWTKPVSRLMAGESYSSGGQTMASRSAPNQTCTFSTWRRANSLAGRKAWMLESADEYRWTCQSLV